MFRGAKQNALSSLLNALSGASERVELDSERAAWASEHVELGPERRVAWASEHVELVTQRVTEWASERVARASKRVEWAPGGAGCEDKNKLRFEQNECSKKGPGNLGPAKTLEPCQASRVLYQTSRSAGFRAKSEPIETTP